MSPTPSSSNQPASSDDRNIVSVESDSSGLSLEDRLFLFWKNYRNAVLVAIVVILGAIVGREVWARMAASREQAISEAFGAADSLEAKRAFANEHPDHPLAGAALLQVGDEQYQNGDYNAAWEAYSEAARLIDDPVLAARARLGAGVSQLQMGQNAEGESTLRQIVEDANVVEAIRAEARLHLAAMEVGTGDIERAREDLDALIQMNAARMWAQQIALLESQIAAVEAQQ